VSAAEVAPGEVYVNDYGSGRAVFFSSWEPGRALTPELDYFWAAEPWEGGTPHRAAAEEARKSFLEDFLSQTEVEPLLKASAPRGVILLPFIREGELVLRALNLHGVGRGDARPRPVRVEVELELPPGTEVARAEKFDFLGDGAALDVSQAGGTVRFSFRLDVHAVGELFLSTKGR